MAAAHRDVATRYLATQDADASSRATSSAPPCQSCSFSSRHSGVARTVAPSHRTVAPSHRRAVAPSHRRVDAASLQIRTAESLLLLHGRKRSSRNRVVEDGILPRELLRLVCSSMSGNTLPFSNQSPRFFFLASLAFWFLRRVFTAWKAYPLPPPFVVSYFSGGTRGFKDWECGLSSCSHRFGLSCFLVSATCLHRFEKK